MVYGERAIIPHVSFVGFFLDFRITGLVAIVRFIYFSFIFYRGTGQKFF
jgi:hypothetical protein